MTDYSTVTIDKVRPVTHTVDPDPARRWYQFGEYRDNPFILNDPATDSLRIVEQIGADRFIVCNQWRTPLMPAPAFYYFHARIVVTPGPIPLFYRVEHPLIANYSHESQSIVVHGNRFPFGDVFQAISQGISGPEKPTPPLPSPLPHIKPECITGDAPEWLKNLPHSASASMRTPFFLEVERLYLMYEADEITPRDFAAGVAALMADEESTDGRPA